MRKGDYSNEPITERNLLSMGFEKDDYTFTFELKDDTVYNSIIVSKAGGQEWIVGIGFMGHRNPIYEKSKYMRDIGAAFQVVGHREGLKLKAR